ncbi:MAG: hypothetical protein AB1938_24390 [Myxococcota bacterium]
MHKLFALLVAVAAVPAVAAEKKVSPQQCEELAKHTFEVILATAKDDPEIQKELRRLPRKEQAAALEAVLADLRAEEKQTLKDLKKDCLDDVRDGVLDQRTFQCVMQAKTHARIEACFDS